jgi:GNAT superfamily N-acetyltransferase
MFAGARQVPQLLSSDNTLEPPMNDLADISLRHATLEDVPALRELVETSTRALCAGDYTPRQLESALRYGMGVDPQLIKDHTYFVAEHAGKRVVGAGGWSFRRTLYGNAHASHGGGAQRLDPRTDAARVRAFFVHPEFTRRGIGRILLAVSQAAAARAGFKQLELAATLTGHPLYRAAGFEIAEPIKSTFPDGVTFHGFRMTKRIDPTLVSHATHDAAQPVPA